MGVELRMNILCTFVPQRAALVDVCDESPMARLEIKLRALIEDLEAADEAERSLHLRR
jgi:hypothetical protein